MAWVKWPRAPTIWDPPQKKSVFGYQTLFFCFTLLKYCLKTKKTFLLISCELRRGPTFAPAPDITILNTSLPTIIAKKQSLYIKISLNLKQDSSRTDEPIDVIFTLFDRYFVYIYKICLNNWIIAFQPSFTTWNSCQGTWAMFFRWKFTGENRFRQEVWE